MLFEPAPLHDAYVIVPEVFSDPRGGFARTFCAREFEANALTPFVAQCNLSFNYRRGTLRGMHYQMQPAAEAKLVRCTNGAIYDVIIDLRPDSETYLRHFGVELTAGNRRALYVPEMFAHGYQALTNGAEVVYQVSTYYSPGLEKGIRYDEPRFGIAWPLPVTLISDKDANWPPFCE